MEKSDIVKKIKEDEDYIRCSKYQNSLSRFITKNPDGIENSAIARLLMISEEEVKTLYSEAIEALRLKMNKD